MPLTTMCSCIYLKIKLPSLKRALNTQANSVILGTNGSNLIFIVVTISWTVFELFVLSLFIHLFSVEGDYFGFVSWVKNKYGDCDSMCQGINFSLNVFIQIGGAISVLGCALAMISLYLLSYHHLALLRRQLYSRLINSSESFVKPFSLQDLKKLRQDEEELNSIEVTINDCIGWMPTVWLAETFFRICATLSVIVVDRMNIRTAFFLSMDIIILDAFLFSSMIYVGIISNEFDMNTVNRLVNQRSRHMEEISVIHDMRFHEEKVEYLLDVSFSIINKPKSFGLFSMNANLLLSFCNTIIPFTVMIVQLISASMT